MKSIDSLSEAKFRVKRGMLVFFSLACLLAFVSGLVEFWPQGALKAFSMGIVITLSAGSALGLAFLVAFPGLMNHLEASWEAKQLKKSQNKSIQATPEGAPD